MRQLTKEFPAQVLSPALETLLAEKLEVYGRKGGGASRLLASAQELLSEETGTEKDQSEPLAKALWALYVAAADEEFSRKRLAEEGHSGLLCPYQPSKEPEDEVERARKAYLRRRKFTYIQCGLILVVIVIYMVIRAYMG